MCQIHHANHTRTNQKENMTDKLLTDAQKKKTENFLLGYRKNKLMLQIEKYEEDNYDEFDIDKYEENPDVTNELIGARMEMYKIRHFIMDLPNGEEKLLLYFHYVKGESIEHCSELIGVSRRSAFRLKHKAMYIAYNELVRRRLIKPEDTQASAHAC